MKQILFFTPFLLLSTTGCVQLNFEAFKEINASQKPEQETKDGMVVSCRPVMSDEESTFFFGLNLPRRNILPVLVHLENRGTDNFTFQPEQFSIALETGDTMTSIPWRSVQKKISFSYWRSLPGFPFGLLPGILIINSVSSANERISADYHGKALEEITLPPGDATQGVVFLKPEKGSSINKNDIANADAWLHFLQRTRKQTVPFAMCFHL